MPIPKLQLNRLTIWMDGEVPCCSPGVVEEHVSQVLDNVRVAEGWITAVQDLLAARRKNVLSPKEEKRVAQTMTDLGISREKAIELLRENFDI